jgi:hypothetical protein
MSAEDFGYTDHQIIFRLVRESLEQDAADTDRYLLEALPEALAPLAASLQAEVGELDPVDDRLLEDLFRGTLKIRRASLAESINQLRLLQEEAQQSSDLPAAAYREMVQQHSALLLLLDQAQIKRNGRRKEG